MPRALLQLKQACVINMEHLFEYYGDSAWGRRLEGWFLANEDYGNLRTILTLKEWDIKYFLPVN